MQSELQTPSPFTGMALPDLSDWQVSRQPARSENLLDRWVLSELNLLVRDVTRIHQLEQMRKDFIANVSHELRTPLTVVVARVQLLRRRLRGIDLD